MPLRVALKVDVDTDRGTREGVPAMLADCREFGVPACYLYSLGPDQTGRAITRVFRPGFFQKVSRTSVVQIYGVRTLLNGTLLPAPHIGQRNAEVMRRAQQDGHEVGIHCYNHYRWQDYVGRMTLDEIRAEFDAARAEFRRIFGTVALTAGAPGWQSNALSRQVYDDSGLLYSSDTRGRSPFFPSIDGCVYRTLEIPSTLPTFDELMGRPEYPSDEAIVAHYLSLLREDLPNVWTIHAELEGMGKRELFRTILRRMKDRGVQFVRMDSLASEYLAQRAQLPIMEQVQGSIDGRSGLLALQAEKPAL